MKVMIAATLMDENQNSNSPYARADMRFTAVISTINVVPICHDGNGSQRWMITAPAMASTGITITQKYQYSQPTENPAQCPSAARVNSVNERTCGISTAI